MPPVRCILSSRSSASDPAPKGAQKTSASGVLEARRSGGKLPETELTLSAQLPESVLEIVDTIVRGAPRCPRAVCEALYDA